MFCWRGATRTVGTPAATPRQKTRGGTSYLSQLVTGHRHQMRRAQLPAVSSVAEGRTAVVPPTRHQFGAQAEDPEPEGLRWRHPGQSGRQIQRADSR